VTRSVRRVVTAHWPEYLIEACCLGLFMLSAAAFATLLEHPASGVRDRLPDPVVRRVLMGAAMGLTAVAIIYSPWGKRSGAHVNPATTLAFHRLGKLARTDAVFYVLAQFAGASLGLWLGSIVLGPFIHHPAVNYVVTVPGSHGAAAAFAAELGMAFLLMSIVLHVSNLPAWNRATGLLVGVLLMLYIGLESPISGMSLNPARTFGSAIVAGVWTDAWVYFTAPLAGMLAAAEVRLVTAGRASVRCAKLHHANAQRCIFCGAPARAHVPGSALTKAAASRGGPATRG